MGLSLQKLAPGVDETKLKELDPIINKCYDESLAEDTEEFQEFYRVVCEIVEKFNEKLGNTQFKLPRHEDLLKEFKNNKGENEQLTKAKFQEIMKNLVKKSAFTGIGAKEVLLCIFGIPLTALIVKQKVMPQAMPDEVFIPGVTSATVFTLAALNKI